MGDEVSGFWRLMLYGKGPREAEAPARDLRIDVIRGLILLIIFVNHIPGNVVSFVTPRNYGFSDAADVFVLLAGISAAFAYGRQIDQRGVLVGSLKVGARIWTLYVAHLALFVLVCGVVATAIARTQNSLYMEWINVLPFFSDTVEAVINALQLSYQPDYLNILPLYIVLLAAFPLAYLAVRTSPLATLLASLALWQAASAFDLNLPSKPGGSGWYFNPFAWQAIFVIGIVMGRFATLGVRQPRILAIDVAAAGLLLFSAAVKLSTGNPFGVAFLSDWIEGLQMGVDKTNLATIRLLHLLALAWIVIRLIPAESRLLRGPVGTRLAATGRHSLEVFCVGIVLSIIGQIVMAEMSFALWAQLLFVAGGLILLIGLGLFLSWYKSLTARPVGVARERAATA